MTFSFAAAKPWETAKRPSGLRNDAWFFAGLPDPHCADPACGTGNECVLFELNGILGILTDERVSHALFVSFGTAFAAAAINVVFGVLIAWVLVRYRFPGRRIIDAIVDLPFALPTAVAGIALIALYAPMAGSARSSSLSAENRLYTDGYRDCADFCRTAFIVRTVQPVMEESTAKWKRLRRLWGNALSDNQSGASTGSCTRRVLTGFALAFARGVGEYGSVIFMPAISRR